MRASTGWSPGVMGARAPARLNASEVWELLTERGQMEVEVLPATEEPTGERRRASGALGMGN